MQQRLQALRPGDDQNAVNRQGNEAFEIYLWRSIRRSSRQSEEEKNIYKQFSPDFFDLIVIDECHRGSAAEDSAWREILDYFSGATHIGLTATPKETKDVSNIHYFGEPVYTYSLRQGIDDGFLAPYKVVRIDIDKDLQGWRPSQGQTDKHGKLIEDRIYNQKDMDRSLVLEKRTELVAQQDHRPSSRPSDPFAKTIVFCDDIDHAERMRQALVNLNPERMKPRTASTSCASPATNRKARPNSTTSSTPKAATRSSPPPAS
jgi:type I restriction enzyme R subunit